MNIKRITRLLKLLEALQAGNGRDADGMARECGVSRRTVFRDLATLRAAGVPLEFDEEDSRYSIASGYFLRPTNFTPDEALSIITLARQLGADNRLPFCKPARTAAQKLERSLPPAVRTRLQRVAQSIHFRVTTYSRLDRQEEVYQQLVEAIGARRVVRMTYDSLTEWEFIKTKVRPYQLLFNRHSWYVIGRSSRHAGTRTFNLARIKTLDVTNEKYVMPRGFSVDRYFGNSWNLMPQEGGDTHVVVRFSQMMAKNVAEVTWHKTQRCEPGPDGSLDFHVDVSGLSEIVWWILGYGEHAKVLKPARLQRLVAQRAQKMHEMYAE